MYIYIYMYFYICILMFFFETIQNGRVLPVAFPVAWSGAPKSPGTTGAFGTSDPEPMGGYAWGWEGFIHGQYVYSYG